MHSVREGNGTPLQYSCLENPMDGGAWQAAVHGVAKSRARLSDFIFTFMHWRRKWQPTPVFLPGESQGWGSLVCCCLWGCTELDTTEAIQQQQQQHCDASIISLKLEKHITRKEKCIPTSLMNEMERYSVTFQQVESKIYLKINTS